MVMGARAEVSRLEILVRDLQAQVDNWKDLYRQANVELKTLRPTKAAMEKFLALGREEQFAQAAAEIRHLREENARLKEALTWRKEERR